MHWMFEKCSSLKKLNIKNFDFSNVTEVQGIFTGCYSLNQLIIDKFNTSKKADVRWVFQKCPEKLKNKMRAKFKNLKEVAFRDY